MATTLVVTMYGDSLTMGTNDAAGNGYRKAFDAYARQANRAFTLSYVGPNSSGDAPTNNYCAQSGATCAILNALTATTFGGGNPYNPTAMIVQVGSGNAATAPGIASFSADYQTMMAGLHAAMPACGFVVSTLPPAVDRQPGLDAINALLPGIWTTLEGSGYVLERATQTMVEILDFGSDQIHPNPVAYAAKMALAYVAPFVRLAARL